MWFNCLYSEICCATRPAANDSVCWGSFRLWNGTTTSTSCMVRKCEMLLRSQKLKLGTTWIYELLLSWTMDFKKQSISHAVFSLHEAWYPCLTQIGAWQDRRRIIFVIVKPTNTLMLWHPTTKRKGLLKKIIKSYPNRMSFSISTNTFFQYLHNLDKQLIKENN